MIEVFLMLFLLLAFVDVIFRIRGRRHSRVTSSMVQAVQAEVKAVRSANVALGQMVHGLEWILSDEVAYAFRLEALVAGLDAILTWESMNCQKATEMRDDIRETIESKPPIAELVQCVDAQNWEAFGRLRRGEKSQIQ